MKKKNKIAEILKMGKFLLIYRYPTHLCEFFFSLLQFAK